MAKISTLPAPAARLDGTEQTVGLKGGANFAAPLTATLGQAKAPVQITGAATTTRFDRCNWRVTQPAATTMACELPIPNRAAGVSLTLAYRLSEFTGAGVIAMVVNSDGTTSGNVVLTADGLLRFQTFVVAAGKTAVGVRLQTNAAASYTAFAVVEDGDEVACRRALAAQSAAVAAEDRARELVAGVEGGLGNLLTDPFLKFLNVTAHIATLGTWVASDVANPFAGGGSVSTNSGSVRIYRKLPPGVLEGAAFSVRARFTQATAGTAALYFVNAAGQNIAAGQKTTPSTVVGDNDVHLSSVVPAGAVAFRFDIFNSGAGKVFALAANLGAAKPTFVEAPKPIDFTEYPEDNLLEDPFLTRLGHIQIRPGVVGSWSPSDPENPFGGGSVAVAVSITRIYRALPKGVRVGDTITVRQFATATTVPTHALYFVDATGTNIAGTSSVVNGVIGAHDRQMRAVVPAGAVGIRVDLTSATNGKVFALALDVGSVIPAFTEAPPTANRNAIHSSMAGKKVVMFGDSILGNVGDLTTLPLTYPETLLARYLEAEVTNCAIGGTTLASRTDSASYSSVSMTEIADAIAAGNWTAQDAAAGSVGGDFAVKVARMKAVSWADVHTVVMAFGTNDYAIPNPIGTTADTTGTTFRGAVHNIVDKLLSAYPHLQIVFQTPIYRDRLVGGPNAASGTGSINGTTLTVTAKTVGAFTAGQTLFARQGMTKRTNIVSQLTGAAGGIGTYQLDRAQNVASTTIYGQLQEPGDVKLNGFDLTLTAYVDAMIEMGGRNAIPVIDAYRNSGVNRQTVTARSEDGVHLSPSVGMYEFMKFMALKLAQTVR